jgi:diaminopimelate epimerase
VKGVATAKDSCKILTPGGELLVRFHQENNNTFNDIWLEGPATFVFKGETKI